MIPKFACNLFDYEMVLPNNQHKCVKKSCNAAYMAPSGLCFQDGNESISGGSNGGKRIKVEALRFLMDSIDEGIPSTLEDMKHDIHDPEARKVANIQYDRHISAIKGRVRDRLAKIKIPRCYTRGVDNMKQFSSRNDRHIQTIKECQHLTENFEFEIEKQQDRLNHLQDENMVCKHQIESFRNDLKRLKVDGKDNSCGRVFDDSFGEKVKGCEGTSLTKNENIDKDDEASKVLTKNRFSFNNFMQEITSPYHTIA